MSTFKVKAEKSIFISHASNDKAIAQDFIDFILNGALGVGIEEIFASTIDGAKIESGDDWRDSIKENLKAAKITFIIITPNYKESEVSLNEMGASWVLSGKTLPLIVEPINYKTVGVIQQPTQIEKLLDEASLDRIRDVVQRELAIPPAKIKSDRWTQKKKEFIIKVKKHIQENPFPVAIERIAFNDLLKEQEELNKIVETLIQEKQKLESQIVDLEKAKSPAEVSIIKEKYNPNDLWADFEKLTEDIKGSLKLLSPIVRGLIYKDFNNKSLQFDWNPYKDDVLIAEAKNYIEIDGDDGSIKVTWDTTNELNVLYNELVELQFFLEHNSDEYFSKKYVSIYSSPCRLDNISFWTEQFTLPIYLK